MPEDVNNTEKSSDTSNETTTTEVAERKKGEMSKGSIFFIVGALAIALLVTLTMQILRSGEAANQLGVKVTSYGEVVAALPLETDGRQTIECADGVNTIVVEGGSVHIEDADCAGGDCMKQGSINGTGQLLVCLPHQLIVEIVPAQRNEFQTPSVYTGNEQVGAGSGTSADGATSTGSSTSTEGSTSVDTVAR